YTDSYRFAVFDKDSVEFGKYLVNGFFLLVKGRVQKRRNNENELEFKIKSINLLSSVRDELIKNVTIKVRAADINQELINQIKQYIKNNPGETELRFLVYDPESKISLPLFSRSIRVRLNNDLTTFLEDHPALDYKVN
ncbi:MAG TPA: DNA polymerase III subunit alpha, partial [Bacteroidales bacterium]|nr:DNA polymerase III subunit alpha [Bacteroidales bacterium]